MALLNKTVARMMANQVISANRLSALYITLAVAIAIVQLASNLKQVESRHRHGGRSTISPTAKAASSTSRTPESCPKLSPEGFGEMKKTCCEKAGETYDEHACGMFVQRGCCNGGPSNKNTGNNNSSIATEPPEDTGRSPKTCSYMNREQPKLRHDCCPAKMTGASVECEDYNHAGCCSSKKEPNKPGRADLELPQEELIKQATDCFAQVIMNIVRVELKIPDVCCSISLLSGIPQCQSSARSFPARASSTTSKEGPSDTGEDKSDDEDLLYEDADKVEEDDKNYQDQP